MVRKVILKCDFSYKVIASQYDIVIVVAGRTNRANGTKIKKVKYVTKKKCFEICLPLFIFGNISNLTIFILTIISYSFYLHFKDCNYAMHNN